MMGAVNTLQAFPTDSIFQASKLGFNQKLTLLELSSCMEDFLRERQTIFRTALSRKLFFHRYQKFGMDEMLFTDAESNVNDLVWEYGSIHQMCRENENENADEPLSIGFQGFGGHVNLDIGDLADYSD